MHAPARLPAEEFVDESHGRSPSGRQRVPRSDGFGQTQCCRVTGTGFMVMASVGQRSTQAPQPVQASRMTLWICLAAPTMASVGQTLMQRQQPMQISSATAAIFGPSSATPERSSVTPSLAASCCASALPPGGQQVTRRVALGDRRGGAGAAGEAALAAVGAGHHGLDLVDRSGCPRRRSSARRRRGRSPAQRTEHRQS